MKNTNKRKIVNFRFFLCLGLALIVMVLTARYLFKSLSSKMLAFIITLSLSAILLILAAIFKRKALAIGFALLLLSSFSILGIFFKQRELEDNQKFNQGSALVVGRICKDYSFSDGGSLRLTLDNLKVINGEYAEEVSGKFVIYLSAASFNLNSFEVGRKVCALLNPQFVSLDTDEYSLVPRGIVGSAYCQSSNLEFLEEGYLSVKDKIKSFTHQKLDEFGVEYGDVAYAMMFGDTSRLDKSIVSVFRETGIAHLLAVSGLHVGLIAFALSFVLKKLRTPQLARLLILGTLLGFYSYICDFSVSVLRASIMFVLFQYSKLRGKPYDTLSALGFAASVLLLASPISLFNVSFVMSFGCIFAISVLSSSLTLALNKIFKPQFSSTLATLISVQLGIIFVNLYYFNSYCLLSVLSNLVVVPLQSLAFVIILSTLPLAMIFPFLGFLPQVFGYITNVAVSFAKLTYSAGPMVSTSSISIAVPVLMFALIYLLGGQVFVGKRAKAVLSCCLAIVAVIFEVTLLI